MENSLGTKIAKLRRNKGFSQQDMADKLDISQPAYHKWESGNVKPDLEALIKMSRIFEVDLSYLTEEGSNLITNNKFEGSNIVGNHQHVININSPELMEGLMKNQQTITEMMTLQNQLLQTLIEKMKKIIIQNFVSYN